MFRPSKKGPSRDTVPLNFVLKSIKTQSVGRRKYITTAKSSELIIYHECYCTE
jgi:hypothetical protein